MDEKQFQYVTVGGIVLTFLFLIFLFGAVVGGETKTVGTKAADGKVKKEFYLFNKKLLSWKTKAV